MKRIRLIKIVVPEIVAYWYCKSERIADFRCTECGFGVAEDYKYCPHCGAELAWDKVMEPSKEFRNLLKKL